MLLKKHMFFFLFILLIGGLILAPKSTLASTLLLHEDFNDGNQFDGTPALWEEILSTNNWSIQGGKYIGSSPPGGGIYPRSLTGNLSWSDYALEATVKSISGVDRHILFRFDQNRSIPKGYAIKYVDSESGFAGHIELQRAGVEVLQSNSTFKSHIGESHRVRVEGIGNRVKVYVDGQKYIDYVDSTPILTGKIGVLIEPSGSGLTNITEYDDILVEQISTFSDDLVTTPIATPFSSPTSLPNSTPVPSLIPTPTPISNTLGVSDLKQYSSPWGNQIYDTANNWSNNSTIDRWGCALTSASMILKYWGHNINPDQLNNWLKSQADGYIGNGLINWLAVSRYTKQHDTNTSPTLEYRRLNGDLQNIVNEINSGRPSVLKLPGHFVVSKGYQGDQYFISDPATTQTTLGYYGNSYLALNQFKPSHTDLSYILLTIDPQYSISVFNSNGNSVGVFNIEEPLIDDVEGNNSGKSLGTFLLPLPEDGIYRVEVTGSSGTYNLNSYVYNTDGGVSLNILEGVMGTDQKDKIQITINGETSSSIKQITIQDILDDWNNLNIQGYIKNKTFYRSVKTLLLTAKKYISKKKYSQAKVVLNLAKTQIKSFTPVFIESKSSEMMTSEIDILISSL
jgi:hypothetical protein